MATNLVSYVMQFLTPDMIGRIAAALGLDRDDAQTGIGAAVPALLAAFSSAADRPGGAQRLADSVRQQSGVLDNLAGMIGGSGQSSLIERGTSMLSSLLGSQEQSVLSGAISRYAGLGQNASTSLLGMLTPLVMGAIGKQIGTRNLDASSLTGLLASQKDQIAQALPSGMSRMLAGTGLLDSLAGATGSAAAAAAGQAGRAAAATGQYAQYASSTARSAVPMWIYWAIPIAVIAGLLWYLFADRIEQLAERQPTPTPSIVVGGVDVRKQVDDSLAQVRTSLAGVTDVESAKAALPGLQAAMTQIDKVNATVGQLPADQRKVVGGWVSSAMATIDQMINKVLAIPGVGDVLKPTADNLRTKLAELSGQPSTVGGGR
jgi:Bacterial protein of unknown function (DUF937)